MKKRNSFKVLEDYAIIFVNKKDKILEVKVDKEDLYKILMVGRWHATQNKYWKNAGYYMCNRPHKKPCIKMHRFIMNCPRDKVVDHINHDTLDNRKQNLRIITQFENNQNQQNNKSGITGVFQRNRKNPKYNYWVGKISKNGKTYKKEFKTKELAIEYRNKMFKKLYGKEQKCL